jgi:predicted MFS family arabinose efflux permease
VTLIAWNLYHVTTWEPVYVVLFMVVGGPGAAAATGLTTALQRAGTDGERGRVFAAFGATFAIGQGVGILAAGTLGDRVGLDAVLNAQGVMLLGSAAIALLWLGEGRRRDEDGDESRIGAGAGEPAGSRGAVGAARGGAVAVESSQ